MSYSESESDFRFVINSVSDFDPESESESDFSSVFMNPDICILLYICILLNKPAGVFFYPFS